jgi:hypothetical protein
MPKGKPFQRIGLILVALAMTLALAGVASHPPVASAQGVLPTSTSGVLQFPTATATQIGGPTATPSRTPAFAPVIAQALGDINLRSGPGVNTDVVGQLKAGDTVPVIGRSVQYPWYVVAWKDAPNGQAWVYKDVVTIIGDITTVPIVEAPPPPTIEPTQYALQLTSTVVLQTPGAAESATARALSQPQPITTVTPAGLASGPLPTFTPPEPYVQPKTLTSPGANATAQTGIPTAVVVIALGASGLLFFGLGLLRRVV